MESIISENDNCENEITQDSVVEEKKIPAEIRRYWLTLEGPSTSIDVFSFRNACKMASVKSYDTIFSEFYFFINTCLLSKFQDFSASVTEKNM